MLRPAIIEYARTGVKPLLSEQALKQVLAQVGVSAPVRFDEVTGSTNETAVALADSGAPEWTLVAAGHQTAGRGRLGRRWVDRPGGALIFSLVLRPQIPAERAGLLPLLAGASMAAACREACGSPVGCKWPNDLMVGDRKVGGVLAESKVAGGEIEHVVLGVGVNLARAPEDVPGAAAIGNCDPLALLSTFLRAFRRLYQPAHPAFAGAVLAGYRDVSLTLGTHVRATTVEGRAVEGRAADLDERGDLIVETDAGREVVGFGDVVHLERP